MAQRWPLHIRIGKVNARIKCIARYASYLDRTSLKVLATGLVQCNLSMHVVHG